MRPLAAKCGQISVAPTLSQPRSLELPGKRFKNEIQGYPVLPQKKTQAGALAVKWGPPL